MADVSVYGSHTRSFPVVMVVIWRRERRVPVVSFPDGKRVSVGHASFRTQQRTFEVPLNSFFLPQLWRVTLQSILSHFSFQPETHRRMWNLLCEAGTLAVRRGFQQGFTKLDIVVRAEEAFEIDVGRQSPEVMGVPIKRRNTEELRAEEVCAVCLDQLRGEKAAAELPCKHLFHGACIQKWFQKKKTCPLCRTSFGGEPSENSSG